MRYTVVRSTHESSSPVGALLSHASDEQLADAAQAGDRAAREALIMRHRRLVPQVARSFRSAGFPFEDLLQAGTIGLILAVDRFDSERGVRFATYASALIRGELQHLLRDHGWAVRVPRPLQELGRAAVSAEVRMTQAHGAPASIHEISEALGEDSGRVAEALGARSAYRAVTLWDEGDDEPDMAAIEALAVDEVGFEEAEHRLAIAAALPRLPVRQRRIIALRFWRGMKQEGIARELGISQMHVSRLLGVALENLAEAMAR
jgi:RNA polymerase sigma-B factor